MSLSSKDPAEKVVITFDFTLANQAISLPEVTVSLKGTLTDIPTMKATAPVINGMKVSIMIQGGESGKSYDLRCKVTLASGEEFVAKDTLLVKTL